ncbi:MAG: ATP-binding protein [Actinobacteria bacterium]|nr:ATP-binding protein [Actinomycetota bacterium]
MRGDEGRVYGIAGYVPATDRRRSRAQLRSARAVEAEHRRQLMAIRRSQQEAERERRRIAGYLPPRGENRPQAGRAWWRLRVPPHRATSEVLAGAYPFLAEEGLGSAGILIGEDAWSRSAFCYDPWTLYERGVLSNPNGILLGQIGRGKSALAKSLAVRCVAFGRRVYVPGDPKGEWSIVTRAVGGQVIELGTGRRARLNPLDEGPRAGDVDDAAWRVQVTQRRLNLLGALAEATLARALGATERTALDAALVAATDRTSVPILPMVVDALLEPERAWRGSSVAQLRDDGREVAHALGRLVHGDLAGLFEGPSTVAFDPSAAMVSLDLSHVSGSDTLLALVHACTSTWMEAALRDPGGGQRLVVYDEAWRLMAQPSLLARMRAQWKLSRGWGLANLMIVHRLGDLDAVGDAGSEARGLALGLLGDTATRILYYEPHEEAEAAGKLLGLSSVEVRELGRLADGEGLWRVNDRAFVVRHARTPAEAVLFNTDSRMVQNPIGLSGPPGAVQAGRVPA